LAHAEHEVDPTLDEYVPASHFEQGIVLPTEYWPEGQLLQVEEPAPENMPTEQVEQLLEPAETEDKPAEQGMHPLAPADEYKPEAHILQIPAPLDAEYLPAQQVMQVEAPVKEYIPCAQLEHTMAEVFEYLPAEQATQALLASSDVYFPEAQLLQRTNEPSDDDEVPAEHFMHDIDPEKECMPAEHKPQLMELVEAANLPAEHAMQLDDRTGEY